MLDATEVLLAFLLLGGVAAFLTKKSKSKRKSLRRKLFTRRLVTVTDACCLCQISIGFKVLLLEFKKLVDI